ncbi:nucleoid occlusion factor SlmA [Rhodobiaceae bacterium]|nr:nucleoid occlusion factor SlmA [Rhodobiaceae bacterium]
MAGETDTPADISTLLPRKKPSQGRSRQTVTKVLDATRDILQTEGHRALTTILVAERSGVTVGSIYQYFPSKHAIIYELYTAWLNDVVAQLDAILENRSDDDSAEDVLKKIFLELLGEDITDNLTRELTQAMQAHPELQTVEADHQTRIATRIGSLLGEMSGTVEDPAIFDFAVAIYRLSVSLMDTVQDTGPQSKAILATWAEMTAESAVRNFSKIVNAKAGSS